jgi:hypothetical protein
MANWGKLSWVEKACIVAVGVAAIVWTLVLWQIEHGK